MCRVRVHREREREREEKMIYFSSASARSSGEMLGHASAGLVDPVLRWMRSGQYLGWALTEAGSLI